MKYLNHSLEALYLFKDIFNNKDMTDKQQRANEIIKNSVGYAATAALIPIPAADIAAVSAVQLNMLRQLGKVYGVNFTENLGKNIITALVSGSLTKVGARIGASLIKAIPGVGTIIGELTLPAISAASTYAMGNVFARHFERGGTFEDFDVRKSKKDYETELENNKDAALKTAEAVQAQQKATQQTTPEDWVTTLKKLAEMRDNGILTEDEFTEMKAKVLAKINN
jgi:uncharacterized protein (DUF697 family)